MVTDGDGGDGGNGMVSDNEKAEETLYVGSQLEFCLVTVTGLSKLNY